MLRHRVIPVLLMSDGGLVKTTKFKDPVYVGDPINAVKIFNDKEVDELVILDIGRGLGGNEPDYETVEDVASECFMPLAYGGGVQSLAHAKRLFRSGVEKVVIRSAAARDLTVVSQIAEFAGSQSVAVSVDVKRSRLGKRKIHAPGTPLNGSDGWLDLIRKAEDAGAGEIFIQSVDRDGTQTGLDLELVSAVSDVVTVPVVAAGGVGSLADLKQGVDAGASAIGVGSFFVFHGRRRAVLITYPEYAVLESLLGDAGERMLNG